MSASYTNGLRTSLGVQAVPGQSAWAQTYAYDWRKLFATAVTDEASHAIGRTYDAGTPYEFWSSAPPSWC